MKKQCKGIFLGYNKYPTIIYNIFEVIVQSINLSKIGFLKTPGLNFKPKRIKEKKSM